MKPLPWCMGPLHKPPSLCGWNLFTNQQAPVCVWSSTSLEAPEVCMEPLHKLSTPVCIVPLDKLSGSCVCKEPLHKSSVICVCVWYPSTNIQAPLSVYGTLHKQSGPLCIWYPPQTIRLLCMHRTTSQKSSGPCVCMVPLHKP